MFYNNHSETEGLLQCIYQAQAERVESMARIDAELAWLAEYRQFVAFMQTYCQEHPVTPNAEEMELEAVRK